MLKTKVPPVTNKTYPWRWQRIEDSIAAVGEKAKTVPKGKHTELIKKVQTKKWRKSAGMVMEIS